MLTEAGLHAKRHERTLSSRRRRAARYRGYGSAAQDRAWKSRWRRSWLADIGDSVERAQKALDARLKQAQESRQALSAMVGPAKKGFISRVKAFFGRGR